jgi:hypothetical protein
MWYDRYCEESYRLCIRLPSMTLGLWDMRDIVSMYVCLNVVFIIHSRFINNLSLYNTCDGTGPYSLNGVPLRRVNQQKYVIATFTKVNLTSAVNTLTSKIDDAFFAREKAAKLTEEVDEFSIFVNIHIFINTYIHFSIRFTCHKMFGFYSWYDTNMFFKTFYWVFLVRCLEPAAHGCFRRKKSRPKWSGHCS